MLMFVAFLLAQLGFDTKLDPMVGMAAVSSTVALFLHLHLPTPALPLLPDLSMAGGAAGKSQQAGSSAAAAKPQQPQPNGVANGQAQMQHSDSGWSLVSAEDARDAPAANGQNGSASNGTGSSSCTVDFVPEGPSEATRTNAANAERVGLSGGNTRSGSGVPAGLDPAPGAEADAGSQGRSTQAVATPPQGGAFLPSAAELRDISGSGKRSSGGNANGSAGSGAGSLADASKQRQSAAEASKIAVSHNTRQAIGQLLGSLAAILELHA